MLYTIAKVGKQYFLVLLILLFLGACQSTTSPEIDVSSDTAVSSPIDETDNSPVTVSEESSTITSPTRESQSTTNNNVVVTVTPDGTPEIKEDLPGTYIMVSDPDYYMFVSYTVTDPSAEVEPATNRVVLSVNLGNNTGDTITVRNEALTLLDEDGNRFTPVADMSLDPQLLGNELNQGESVYGFVSFDIPDDANPAYLEWCLSGDSPCERPLHFAVELAEN